YPLERHGSHEHQNGHDDEPENADQMAEEAPCLRVGMPPDEPCPGQRQDGDARRRDKLLERGGLRREGSGGLAHAWALWPPRRPRRPALRLADVFGPESGPPAPAGFPLIKSGQRKRTSMP